MAKRENWIWMPHAAHFMVGHKCQFKLATCVGDYLVSTVGEYLPDSAVMKILAESRKMVVPGLGDEYEDNWLKRNGFEEIGYGRLYETMVFLCGPNPHLDQQCCPYHVVDHTELDVGCYNSAQEAYAGHLTLCEKWARRRHKGLKPTREESRVALDKGIAEWREKLDPLQKE